MSDVSKQMIICPHCNRTSLFNIWSSINTKTDPAAYSQVRNLSLFKFRCPYCEKTEIVHYPFLYHQMESAVMIYYQPKGEELADTQNMFEDVNAEAFGNPDAGQDEIQDMLKNALAGYRPGRLFGKAGDPGRRCRRPDRGTDQGNAGSPGRTAAGGRRIPCQGSPVRLGTGNQRDETGIFRQKQRPDSQHIL